MLAGALASFAGNFESGHVEAEDVCVCVFDTGTFIFSLSTGRLGMSVARAHGRVGLGVHERNILRGYV